LILCYFYSYIAAKTCYFGIGGGTQDFAAYVRRFNIFNVEVVHSIITGFGIIQTIIKYFSLVINKLSCRIDFVAAFLHVVCFLT